MQSLFKMAQAMGSSVCRARTLPDQVSYTIFSKNKTGSASVFTIGARIVKRMHWIAGDRVDVLYDPQLAEGQIIRCKEGGWQLTDWGKENSPVRLRISYRKEFGLPLVEGRVDLAVDLTENTIAFAFPTDYRVPLKVENGGRTTITAGKTK